MSTTPTVPEPPGTVHLDHAPPPRWIFAAFLLIFALLGYLLYAGYSERSKLRKELAATKVRAEQTEIRLDQTNSRVAELKGQLDVTSGKLGLTQAELARARSLAQSIRKQQQESDSRLTAKLGQVQQESQQKIGQVAEAVSGAKTDIAANRQDLEATKARLASTMGDLGVQSGLIARNREELEELKRIGQRNYFDFTLRKSKHPSRVGPIQIALRKVDTKHYRYTMTVVADDKAIEKKDKTLNEPVQFYVKGVRVPYEIVVFEMSKNRATGYLSTPKEPVAAKPSK